MTFRLISALHNITDSLCFLIVRYSDSYHSYDRVFISPIGVQNRGLIQKVHVGTLQNRAEMSTFSFMYHIIHVYNI